MGISAICGHSASDRDRSNVDRAKMQQVPKHPHHIWYTRGKMLTKQGHFEAALTSFEIALKYHSGVHQIWAYQGVVLAYMKCYESALASFNKALELAPDNREVWIFRGAVLSYLNRRREATNSYNVALSLQQRGFMVSEEYPTTWMPNPLHSKGMAGVAS